MEHHAVKMYEITFTINILLLTPPPLPTHRPMLFIFKNREKGQFTTEATAYSKKLIMKIG